MNNQDIRNTLDTLTKLTEDGSSYYMGSFDDFLEEVGNRFENSDNYHSGMEMADNVVMSVVDQLTDDQVREFLAMATVKILGINGWDN